MIQGKHAIREYFEASKMPYYAIFYKGQVEKGNPIFRNDKEDQDKELDFTDGLNSFDASLRLLGYGNYVLIVSDKKNVTQRGSNRVEFKIDSEVATQQPVAGIGAIGVGYVSREEAEQMAAKIADERFTRLMEKKELETTKEKLKETEKQLKEVSETVNAPWNKFIGALAPHSEAIMGHFFPRGVKQNIAQTVVSGVAPDSVADGEVNKLFEEFATALCEARPNDWKEILIKLTGLIKNDPAKLEMALKFI